MCWMYVCGMLFNQIFRLEWEFLKSAGRLSVSDNCFVLDSGGFSEWLMLVPCLVWWWLVCVLVCWCHWYLVWWWVNLFWWISCYYWGAWDGFLSEIDRALIWWVVLWTERCLYLIFFLRVYILYALKTLEMVLLH